MMIKNFETDFNFLEEWEKVSSHPDLVFRANELARLSLIHKAAVTTLYIGEFLDYPQGILRLEWDHFLRTCIEHEKFSVIYEYCYFAAKKNQVIPVNLLVDLIQLADRNLEFAELIIPVLGECGQYLLNQNPKWNYLIREQIDFSQKKSAHSKLFLVKKKLRQFPEDGLQLILEQFERWSEKELNIIIEYIAKIKLGNSVNRYIEDLLKKLQVIKNINYYPLLFRMDETFFANEYKEFTNEQIGKDNWDGLRSKRLFKTSTRVDFKFVVANLPVDWILGDNFSKYLNFIKDQQLFESLADALILYQDSQGAAKLCLYLLENNIFTEYYPIEKISTLLDHQHFNEIAIQVLKEGKDQTDLEAFLFLIKHYKHFWNDELVLELLKTFKIKKLEDVYNFDIFYDFFVYRMNPNSTLEKEIPLSIKNSLKHPFNYSIILNFRKIIRK